MDKKPCEKRERVITSADLPLSCPMPNERVRDGHPRVYLAVDDTNEVVCPYCETKYLLSGPHVASH